MNHKSFYEKPGNINKLNERLSEAFLNVKNINIGCKLQSIHKEIIIIR